MNPASPYVNNYIRIYVYTSESKCKDRYQSKLKPICIYIYIYVCTYVHVYTHIYIYTHHTTITRVLVYEVMQAFHHQEGLWLALPEEGSLTRHKTFFLESCLTNLHGLSTRKVGLELSWQSSPAPSCFGCPWCKDFKSDPHQIWQLCQQLKNPARATAYLTTTNQESNQGCLFAS